MDGKLGSGVLSLRRETLKAGLRINEKIEKRGIQPRAVRVGDYGGCDRSDE